MESPEFAVERAEVDGAIGGDRGRGIGKGGNGDGPGEGGVLEAGSRGGERR